MKEDYSFESAPPAGEAKLSVFQLFLIFLRLGLTSFGGPVAHLGYFREEFVTRRKCLGEHDYADLVALCQFLPGPASSQVGMGIGISQGGVRGALAAWLGFTLPSVVVLVLFAYGIALMPTDFAGSGWMHGLKVVAVAVVAQAIWGMARTLCSGRLRATVAILAASLMLALPNAMTQIVVIFSGGLFGLLFLGSDDEVEQTTLQIPIDRRTGFLNLALFGLLLCGLPIFSYIYPNHTIDLIDHFYRAGALVFGGGHVVLPLLREATVSQGWISKGLFLAGYGAAQTVPGPLFTFAAYLGAVMSLEPHGWVGAIICLVSIFLPSLFLLLGILPFWDQIRRIMEVRCVMSGVNAAVVGLLLAVFYDTVWSGGILSANDFILALIAFALLTFWKMPSWVVVLLTAVSSAALSAVQLYPGL
ncbi:MAG: chromate efflux transporter [Chlorobiaceae bacterium]|nr:chromate efflux transporter [Chlorobiaceae bacterium]